MRKPGAKPPSSSKGNRVVVRTTSSGSRSSKVKFGSVTVTGVKPKASTVSANVARSSEALARAAKRLSKPGVRLPVKKGVPQYWTAEDEPTIIIRKLDGQINRGRLIEGKFKVID